MLQPSVPLRAEVDLVQTGVTCMNFMVICCRLFELRCLQISVRDRTPFLALLKIVESAVIEEARRRPWSPVYLVGEGLGGALALAIAARNPALDLLLILVNPATSFPDSPLHSLVRLMSNLPWEHPFSVPSPLLNIVLGTFSPTYTTKQIL